MLAYAPPCCGMLMASLDDSQGPCQVQGAFVTNTNSRTNQCTLQWWVWSCYKRKPYVSLLRHTTGPWIWLVTWLPQGRFQAIHPKQPRHARTMLRSYDAKQCSFRNHKAESITGVEKNRGRWHWNRKFQCLWSKQKRGKGPSHWWCGIFQSDGWFAEPKLKSKLHNSGISRNMLIYIVLVDLKKHKPTKIGIPPWEKKRQKGCHALPDPSILQAEKPHRAWEGANGSIESIGVSNPEDVDSSWIQSVMCHAGEWKDILIRIPGSFTCETWTKMICRTTLVIISPW